MRDRWNTQELQEDFQVKSFAYGLVFVVRKSDGKSGALRFDHSPRVYYGWSEDV